MEVLGSLLSIPYAFHCVIVTVVFVGAVLLFVFGFKSAEEPAFIKIKTDSKSATKKKKGKDKKLSNGIASLTESKSKANSTPKSKTKNNDEKNKKPNALKDSKKINLNMKNTKKENTENDKFKSKGKENIDAIPDFDDEEGVWEQALSRKKNRKTPNSFPEALKGADKKSSGKGNDGKKSKDKGNKIKENSKSSNSPNIDKKFNDDGGDWQEAKSGKKRRKIQKED